VFAFWWIKWSWDRFFSEFFGFPLPVSFRHCFMFTHVICWVTVSPLQAEFYGDTLLSLRKIIRSNKEFNRLRLTKYVTVIFTTLFLLVLGVLPNLMDKNWLNRAYRF
jgi:hypothetical protein